MAQVFSYSVTVLSATAQLNQTIKMKTSIKSILTTAIITTGISTLLFAQPPAVDPEKTDDLKINQIQVLGTHNSYARPVDSVVMAYADPIFEKMMGSYEKSMPQAQMDAFKENHPNGMKMSEGLKYNHPPFDVQLDAGLRALEIDVYYDPTGNRFNKPAAYRELQQKGITNLALFDTSGLSQPGFKVLHIADFDFRTHYPTLERALQALKSWSDGHPGHIPITIMVEAKDKGLPVFPNPATVLPFTAKAFDELDEQVLSILGRDKLITPDDVRGGYPTLRDAVLAQNWPTVKEARGKFIFLLLPGSAGLAADQESPYSAGRPNLEKRVMFVQSMPRDTYAAFLLLDNAIVRKAEIQKYVGQGYMVRSRADIETYEAKMNDYTRARAAFESGAQVISTDFFREGNGYGTGYKVSLPGGGAVRPNPVNATSR